MKTTLLLILLIGISLSFISATSIPVAETKVTEDTTAKVSTSLKHLAEVKAKRMGFFQKKHQYKVPDDTAKADKIANTSLWFGIVALFLDLTIYLFFLRILSGILAVIAGSYAKKSGTKKIRKANIGLWLGIAALAAAPVAIIIISKVGVFGSF